MSLSGCSPYRTILLTWLQRYDPHVEPWIPTRAAGLTPTISTHATGNLKRDYPFWESPPLKSSLSSYMRLDFFPVESFDMQRSTTRSHVIVNPIPIPGRLLSNLEVSFIQDIESNANDESKHTTILLFSNVPFPFPKPCSFTVRPKYLQRGPDSDEVTAQPRSVPGIQRHQPP